MMSKGWKRKDKNNERGYIAIRYRAYPTNEQDQKAVQIDGCCRQVKNLAKEQRDLAYRLTGKSPGYTVQTKNLKELRDDPDLAPWLADIPSQILQQALRDTDSAYQRFFSGNAKYPTWAKKSSRISFRDPQYVQVRKLSSRWGEVKLQGMDWIKIRMHRPLVGNRICSATYVKESDGKVFVSILCERRKRQPTKPRIDDPTFETTVGVDRGGVMAVAAYDGQESDLRDFTPLSKGERERLRRLEKEWERKKLARIKENARLKSEGKETHRYKSKKQEKTERKIASLRARRRRRAHDFNEQISNDLAKNHSRIVFEDLSLEKMTRSARGTVDAPGKNVTQKAGMNRVMREKAGAQLKLRTDQKVIRHGHLTFEVPAPYTSVTCCVCGHVDKQNRASRDLFRCVKCGYEAHADSNAAINIRERGIKLVLAGGTPVAAHQGTNLEPDFSGAEPGAVRAGHGSGNKEMGYITERVVA